MSTATAEKTAAPLASFLDKIAPKPAEKAPESKAEPKEVPNAKAEVAQPAVEQAPTETAKETPKTAETVVEKVEVKAEEKPKEDITEKRLKDTQKWGNEEHKARLEAERRAALFEAQLKRIEAKLDGTYEEPTAPSTEYIAADADTKGRIRASHKAAVRQFGEKFVLETVWNPDSPYQELDKDPRIRARVMEADDPVLEAIAVVKEHQDGLKYGRTPEEIRKKIREEEAPKLKQEILEGLKTKPGTATNTLGNVRGGTERTAQKDDVPAQLDFRKVFPHGASRI